MNPHVMSKYATQLECLQARDAWSGERIAELEALVAQQAAVIEQMRAAVKENDRWHAVYDEHGGYPESDLCEINTKALALQPCPEVLNKVRAEVVWKFFDYFVDGRLANIHISEADNYIRRIEKGEA